MTATVRSDGNPPPSARHFTTIEIGGDGLWTG
ncbi:hypothetical protein ABH935_009766 [Catenulispora sp. GAS73]